LQETIEAAITKSQCCPSSVAASSRLTPAAAYLKVVPEMNDCQTHRQDAAILKMKSGGQSFSEIARRLEKSLGSITGRYYRLVGVRHPSQIARDLALKEQRKVARIVRKHAKTMAAVQASIAIKNGIEFFAAVRTARAAGASFDAIGACLGITGSALHKKWRANIAQTNPSIVQRAVRRSQVRVNAISLKAP
jgi:hypothetical protein